MGGKHGPDGEKHVHQDYKIELERVAQDTWGDSCRDGGTILIHDQEQARKIMAFLRELGFAVSLERRTKTMLESDEFPEEEEESNG